MAGPVKTSFSASGLEFETERSERFNAKLTECIKMADRLENTSLKTTTFA